RDRVEVGLTRAPLEGVDHHDVADLLLRDALAQLPALEAPLVAVVDRAALDVVVLDPVLVGRRVGLDAAPAHAAAPDVPTPLLGLLLVGPADRDHLLVDLGLADPADDHVPVLEHDHARLRGRGEHQQRQAGEQGGTAHRTSSLGAPAPGAALETLTGPRS